MNRLPADIDPQLWVIVRGREGRCYLSANAHTFRGRMEVWSDELQHDVSISRHEIVESSKEAGYWIDGFLSGNEPEGEEMFGPAFSDGDAEKGQRWHLACKKLRKTGEWSYGYWQLPLGFPSDAALPVQPWYLKVDKVYYWDGIYWVLAQPQPHRDFKLIDGTVCFSRKFHNLTEVTDCHLLCVDCGITSETVPDGISSEEWAEARYQYRPKTTA